MVCSVLRCKVDFLLNFVQRVVDDGPQQTDVLLRTFEAGERETSPSALVCSEGLPSCT